MAESTPQPKKWSASAPTHHINTLSYISHCPQRVSPRALETGALWVHSTCDWRPKSRTWKQNKMFSKSQHPFKRESSYQVHEIFASRSLINWEWREQDAIESEVQRKSKPCPQQKIKTTLHCTLPLIYKKFASISGSLETKEVIFCSKNDRIQRGWGTRRIGFRPLKMAFWRHFFSDWKNSPKWRQSRKNFTNCLKGSHIILWWSFTENWSRGECVWGPQEMKRKGEEKQNGKKQRFLSVALLHGRKISCMTSHWNQRKKWNQERHKLTRELGERVARKEKRGFGTRFYWF